MKRLRICICVSGQMRSFERNFGWLDALRERHDVTVIVSTYRQRGGKVVGNLSSERVRSLLPNNLTDALPPSWLGGNLFEHLPGLRERALARAFQDRLTVETIERTLPGAHVHVEDEVQFAWFEQPQLSRPQGSADPFSLRMLYKIWQADRLRANAEQAQGAPFDAVVRMRPDRPISGLDDAVLARLRPGKLFIEVVRAQDRFAGDQFALGDGATMSVYADFFVHAFARARAGQWSLIHNELYDHLIAAGLSLDAYNPLLDYASDRLLDVGDVLAALDRRRREPAPDLPGYRPDGPADLDVLTRIVTLADQLGEGARGPADPGVIAAFDGILRTPFVPARDGGLAHYVLANVGADLDPGTRLLLAALACASMPTATLMRTFPYTHEVCVAIEGLAARARRVPDDGAGWIALAEAAADAHPLRAPVAALLADPGWRMVVERALDDAVRELLRLDVGLWCRISAQLEAGGDFAEAERLMRAVLARAPDHGIAWIRLATILGETGRAADSASAATRAAELEPGHPGIQMHAARLLHRAGDAGAALRTIERALRAAPDHAGHLRLRDELRAALAARADTVA